MPTEMSSMLPGEQLQQIINEAVSLKGAAPMVLLRGDRIAGANTAFDDLLGPLPDSASPRFSDLVAEGDRLRVAKNLEKASRATHSPLLLSFRASGSDQSVRDFGLHWMRSGALDDTLAVGILFEMPGHAGRRPHEGPFLAFHDPVTGLMTEAALLDRFRVMLPEARWQKRRLTLILTRVEGLEAIDAQLACSAIDPALALTAKRLVTCVRKSDFPARAGADGFAVLSRDLKTAEDALLIAERIAEQVATPMQIGGRIVSLTARSGIAIYPDQASDVGSLFACAQSALTLGKTEGRTASYEPGLMPDSEPYRFELIAWREAYANGVDILDDQHRDLFDRANRVANELQKLAHGAGLITAYDELVEAARIHFQTEERLLQACQASTADLHAAEHSKMLRDLKTFKTELPHRSLALSLRYLEEWLLRHITGSDRQVAKELREARAIA